MPPLQLMPRLQAAADGDGGALPTGRNLRLRGGVIAVLVALAVAAVVVLVAHRSHRAPRGISTAVASRERERTGARLALAGVHAASNSMLKAVATASGRTVALTQSTPVPHYLSSSDLTTLAGGASLYQPARYLVGAYQTVGARFNIPWRVLASIEYLQGGYVDAIAGAGAKAEQTVSSQVQAGGRDAVNAHVLAQATAAAAEPSTTLVSDAKRLVADGASQSPAQGVATYMRDAGTTAQSVMTLAQSIAPASSASSAPLAKVSSMLNEAHLLNGLPYVWGGGHTNPAWVVGSGYDCSGFVSEVLHSAGYLGSPDTTQTLPGSAGIVNGPGKYVTIYDRTIATIKVWRKKKVTVKKIVNPASAGVHRDAGRKANSLNSVSITLPKWVGEWKTLKTTQLVQSLDNNNNDEHVIIDIDGQWWESGGDTADGGGAMVHQIIDPSTAYLKSFNRILHPKGL